MSIGLERIIEFLEEYEKSITVPLGFSNPIVIYTEPPIIKVIAAEGITIGEMLSKLKPLLNSNSGSPYNICVDEFTKVYLTTPFNLSDGSDIPTRECVGLVLLNYMVGNYSYV